MSINLKARLPFRLRALLPPMTSCLKGWRMRLLKKVTVIPVLMTAVRGVSLSMLCMRLSRLGLARSTMTQLTAPGLTLLASAPRQSL